MMNEIKRFCDFAGSFCGSSSSPSAIVSADGLLKHVPEVFDFLTFCRSQPRSPLSLRVGEHGSGRCNNLVISRFWGCLLERRASLGVEFEIVCVLERRGRVSAGVAMLSRPCKLFRRTISVCVSPTSLARACPDIRFSKFSIRYWCHSSSVKIIFAPGGGNGSVAYFAGKTLSLF